MDTRREPELAHRVARDRGGDKERPASISTSAITPPTSTERTTPEKRLRADPLAPVRWRCGPRSSRATSDAGTQRRPRSSRRVRSFPDRSQRLSVSTLTPIAAAAALSGISPCLVIV